MSLMILQQSILFLGIILIITSIILFHWSEKKKTSVFLLLIGGLAFRIVMALLDPFINLWDEQFHALVAKNMLETPFRPVLYKTPVLPYYPCNWTGNHIWVHKQPFFLWQVALSFKLFGINEFSLRLPSAIMLAVIPYFIYRLGKLTLNEKIGYYGAFLFVTAHYFLEFGSGARPTDHNDIAFIFYVTASIWSWIEYTSSHKRYWLIFIGLFSGIAILCKWLTGLLVYSGWMLALISDRSKRFSFYSYLPLLYSVIITLLVCIPWQVYIMKAFPTESDCTFNLNIRHFSEVLEGHGGNSLFYFYNLNDLYGGGQLVPYIIIFSLVLFWKKLNHLIYKVAFLSYILIVYIFFTMAATKMEAFCAIVSSLVFLSLGNLIHTAFLFTGKRITLKKPFRDGFIVTFLLFVGILNVDGKKIIRRHSLWDSGKNTYRETRLHNSGVYKKIDGLLSNEYVIFNCKPFENVMLMFYSGCTGYDFIPNFTDYQVLKQKQVKIAVFADEKLPEYLKNDSQVMILKYMLKE